MNRPWQAGLRARDGSLRYRRLGVLGLVLVLGGLGWLFGGRLVHLARLSRQASALQSAEIELVRARGEHRETLARAEDPEFIERRARELDWGYPEENLVIFEGH